MLVAWRFFSMNVVEKKISSQTMIGEHYFSDCLLKWKNHRMYPEAK